MSAIDGLMAAQRAVNEMALSLAVGESPSPNTDEAVTHRPPMAQPSGNAKPGKQPLEMNNELLKELIEKLNSEYHSRNVSLQFSIDEPTKSLVVRVLDSDNKELIRQIPPDAILALRRHMKELQGTLIDKRA